MNDLYSQYALPVGSMVQEYRIIEILGIGNFGIVYKAENKYFSEIVALKEFLPTDLAFRTEDESRIVPLSSETEDAFQWALKKFLQEAKTLRELGSPVQHPNIVRVRQFIEANDTAYMVMDFEKGRSLADILKECESLEEKEITGILEALLDGLTRVHGASVWHRDIKPSNILIRSDGSPVLIDFGAARKDITGADRSTMAVFSPAYAAPEQIYPIGDQGPWTDIYALGATLYRAATGDVPTNAAKRLQGEGYTSAEEKAKGLYSPAFLAGIDAALELYPKDRPQSISAWKESFTAVPIDEGEKTLLRPIPEPEVGPKRKKIGYRGLFALIVLAIAVAGGWWMYRLADRSRTIDRFDAAVRTEKEFSAQNEMQADQTADKIDIVVAEDDKLAKEDTEAADVTDDDSALMDQTGTTVESDREFATQAEVSGIQAHLMIESVPAGAQVFIDNQLKGTTPLDMTVIEGTHALRLSLDAHYDWDSTLLVEEEGAIPIRIPMLKK